MTSRTNHPGTLTEIEKSGRCHPVYRSTVRTDDVDEHTDSASSSGTSSTSSRILTSESLCERRWCISYVTSASQFYLSKFKIVSDGDGWFSDEAFIDAHKTESLCREERQVRRKHDQRGYPLNGVPAGEPYWDGVNEHEEHCDTETRSCN